MKEKVTEASRHMLNMESIRKILKEKGDNLNSIYSETDDIEALINEIKISELKYAEFEEQEKMKKGLLRDLWPKIPLLKELFEDYKKKYELVTTDLKPLEELLKTMRGHDDYSEDQEFVNEMLENVSTLIDEQNEVDYSVDPNISFIEELCSEESKLTINSELNDLDSKNETANDVVKILKENIDKLAAISESAQSHRTNLKDAFIGRNYNFKEQQYNQFTIRVKTLKEKMDMILERVNNEKKDTQLDDYHKEIIEDVESTLAEKQTPLEALQEKVESDKGIIEEFNTEVEGNDLEKEPCAHLKK